MGAPSTRCVLCPMRPLSEEADDHGVGNKPDHCTEVKRMRAPIQEIPLEMKVDGIETRGVDWGDQLVRHIDLPAGADFTPLLKGLPDDMCQCPHWGIVLAGSIPLRFAEGSAEVTEA